MSRTLYTVALCAANRTTQSNEALYSKVKILASYLSSAALGTLDYVKH